MKHQRQSLSADYEAIPARCTDTAWYGLDDDGLMRICAPNHPGAIEITCGKCRRCCITKRNQISGRMLAEQETSFESVFLTLTYAPEKDGSYPPGATSIDDVHVHHTRNFRKVMRKRYGQSQYCGVAERGEIRKRVHDHFGFFFDEANCRLPGSKPKGPDDKRKVLPEWIYVAREVERAHRNAQRNGLFDRDNKFMCCGVKCRGQYSVKHERYEFVTWIPEWPHGYVHIGEMNGLTARYIAKYILSPEKGRVLNGPNSIHNTLETKVFRSRRLSYKFVQKLGERYADAGLPPRDRYTVSTDTMVASGPAAGKPREYTMTRGMKRELVESHMRRIARKLHLGELTSWKAKGEPGEGYLLVDRIEADAKNDPRNQLERFFQDYYGGKHRSTGVPYVELGAVHRVVTCPDGGVVLKDERGDYVFSWPDLSAHGRDVRIPIETRGELRRALRAGGAAAFGLHPPDVRIEERSVRVCDVGRAKPVNVVGKYSFWPDVPKGGNLSKSRRELRRRFLAVSCEGDKPKPLQVWPVWQVLELRGRGVAEPELRAAVQAARKAGFVVKPLSDVQLDAIRRRVPGASAAALAAVQEAQRRAAAAVGAQRVKRLSLRELRAWVTGAQLDAIRKRVVRFQLARWKSAGRREAKFGLPASWVGSVMTPEAADRFPLFAKWWSEVNPHAAPF